VQAEIEEIEEREEIRNINTENDEVQEELLEDSAEKVAVLSPDFLPAD